MIIDLNKVPLEDGFKFIRGNGLTLICPNCVWPKWNNQNKIFRSLVVRELDGLVVSAGFPKFGNVQNERLLPRKT